MPTVTLFKFGQYKVNDILLIAVLCTSIPVFFDYSLRMMAQGHYQFFPLVILVSVWWGWQHKSQVLEQSSPANPGIVTFGLLTSLFLLGSASLFTSTFVGAFGLLAVVVTVLYWLFGAISLKSLTTSIFLLLFIIPIPFRADAFLILKMQFLASQLASWILDAVGEMHFREGVVLIGENRSFLTEEACSGIRSLFSSLAAMSIYGVVLGQRWWRILINLIQVVGWVIVGNGLRVAIVVYGVTHWTEQLGTGVAHDALGLLVFFFIVAMALSTDRLLQSLMPGRTKEVNSESTIDPVTVPAGKASVSETPATQWEWVKPMGTYVFIALFSLVAFVGGRRQIIRFMDPRSQLVSVQTLPPPLESDVPVTIGKWQRTDFEVINRGKDNLMAEQSFVWKFTNGKLTALFSLDAPFNSWHDLTLCYSGLGWQTKLTQHYGDSKEKNGYSELKLHRVSGENAFVLFSTVDRNGSEVSPPMEYGVVNRKAMWEMVSLKVAAALGLSADSASELRGIPLPASAFQLYCSPQTELSKQEILELTELFQAAGAILRNSGRFHADR